MFQFGSSECLLLSHYPPPLKQRSVLFIWWNDHTSVFWMTIVPMQTKFAEFETASLIECLSWKYFECRFRDVKRKILIIEFIDWCPFQPLRFVVILMQYCTECHWATQVFFSNKNEKRKVCSVSVHHHYGKEKQYANVTPFD